MKKLLCVFLCVVMVSFTCACSNRHRAQRDDNQAAQAKTNYMQNMKGVWLSYYEIGDMFKSADPSTAKELLENMCRSLAKIGVNTLFFHVRAFCDAIYTSDVFPLSDDAPQEYDLLQLAVEAAHRHRISIHAWVNPYRVSTDANPQHLPENSPARSLYEEDESNLLICENGIYLNPASTKAQALILDGIREVINAYDIDGIHFDDYFYPTPDLEIDAQTYETYQKGGGTLTQEDFRCENVSVLIDAVYELVKQENENMLFGVSPQCSVEKNKEQLSADVEQWLERSSVDYLMPQIYFGFENETAPFKASVERWLKLMKGRSQMLYVGLALYKSGKEDAYASDNTEQETSPYYEWMNHDDIIARQIAYLQQNGIKGYSLYAASSLLNPGENTILQGEIEHLSAYLKT